MPASRQWVHSLTSPEGLLGIVFGFQAGEALGDAPSIAGVGFTGSFAAGTALWRRANARPVPIPFYGELGAVNPLVVTYAAAADRAQEIGKGIAGSVALGVGQFCTKPGLIFAPLNEDGDALVTELSEALTQLPGMTMLTSEIAERFRAGTRALENLSGGCQLVVGERLSEARVRAELFEVPASLFADSRESTVRDEYFGPLAIIVRYRDQMELRRALGAATPALTFSVFLGENDTDADSLVNLASTKAGRVIANAY